MSMPDICLVSTCHQRFENGEPVQELQKCFRVLKVQQYNGMNAQGYVGLDGSAFLFSIYNADANVTDLTLRVMRQKPMRLLESSPELLQFRGYEVSAKTPFGLQNIDMSCYGINIPQNQENPEYVWRLNMFDKNVYIDYYYRQTAFTYGVQENIELIKWGNF